MSDHKRREQFEEEVRRARLVLDASDAAAHSAAAATLADIRKHAAACLKGLGKESPPASFPISVSSLTAAVCSAFFAGVSSGTLKRALNPSVVEVFKLATEHAQRLSEECVSQLAVLAYHVLLVQTKYGVELAATPDPQACKQLIGMKEACTMLLAHDTRSRQPERFLEGLCVLELCGHSTSGLLFHWHERMRSDVTAPCYPAVLQQALHLPRRQKAPKAADSLINAAGLADVIHWRIVLFMYAAIVRVRLPVELAPSREEEEGRGSLQQQASSGEPWVHPSLLSPAFSALAPLELAAAGHRVQVRINEKLSRADLQQPVQFGLYATDAFAIADVVTGYGGILRHVSDLTQEGASPVIAHCRRVPDSDFLLDGFPLACMLRRPIARSIGQLEEWLRRDPATLLPDGSMFSKAQLQRFRNSALGFMANTAVATQCNVRVGSQCVVVGDITYQVPVLQATRAIKSGDEILCAYNSNEAKQLLARQRGAAATATPQQSMRMEQLHEEEESAESQAAEEKSAAEEAASSDGEKSAKASSSHSAARAKSQRAAAAASSSESETDAPAEANAARSSPAPSTRNRRRTASSLAAATASPPTQRRAQASLKSPAAAASSSISTPED